MQTLLAFSGNAQPQLALTRQLIERGHEVRVLAHRAARERIEATGAEFVPFRRAQPDLDISRRETDTLRDWQARTRPGAGMRLLRNGLFAFVLDVSRDCAELLARWPADVVAFDWMLIGGAIAAQGAGVPAVALVHCPYPLPVAGAPTLFTGLRPMRGPLGALRDRLVNRIASRLLQSGLPVLNRARAEQGLAPLERWEQQLLGASSIFMMSAAELDFSSSGALPANVHYVGPAFEPYARDWSSPWPETNTDPLVVISLSTSYMDQRALAQRILDAVAGLPVRALLTAGPALDTSGLELPGNARVSSFVPHRSVFPHAALVISHAGWQTINAALADGVPLLCLPDGRDQPDNAARVLVAGAGVRARKGTPPRRLRKLIARALDDPALRRGADAIAGALGASDGALTIADALEQLVSAPAASAI
ncbi:MAG TPA: nucleotide disphospho-sugar-binding domain-containing protein [Solirubrobacteraceae bacterium]|nr:nucleotide disphospho-sugar-binding domain-containing protein [Solirubrobacteraceae bacterium]